MVVTEQSFLYSKWFLEGLKIAEWFSLGGVHLWILETCIRQLGLFQLKERSQ